MRTLTVKGGGGGNSFAPGWHNVIIETATYGDFEGTQFLDITFEGFPESFNMRTYAKHGKDGEEFAIGRVFRFANAGICEVSKSDSGDSIVELDDNPEHLISKEIWIFMYKDGEYYRALNRIAPTEFIGKLETFNEKDVAYWKKNAMDYYTKFVDKPKDENSDWGSDATETESNGVSEKPTEGTWEDIQKVVSEVQNSEGIPS